MNTVPNFKLTSEFVAQIEQELTANILPFWLNQTKDPVNGGFFGAVSNSLQVDNTIPRTAILCARILWTFSAAYRKNGHPEYLAMAQYAHQYLTQVFWDTEHGGLYWSVDAQGNPALDRKHHYVQAFGIYGLTEYYRVTQDDLSLKLAQELFQLLEAHAFDPVHGGYIEGSCRSWGSLADMRLSDKEINCRKTMNTMLHILEAYTNLLRVWDNPHLKTQHRALIEIFLTKIINPDNHHFRLFFDDGWQSLDDHISYGHDIEGSWLLVEAAQVQADSGLLNRVENKATQMAAAVYANGLDQDGSLFYEGDPSGLTNSNKSWWVQAEAMVGFYNAFQLTGDEKYLLAVQQLWTYIQNYLVDPIYGGWIKARRRDGTIVASTPKTGPWECPYHHSRACLEMLDRIEL